MLAKCLAEEDLVEWHLKVEVFTPAAARTITVHLDKVAEDTEEWGFLKLIKKASLSERSGAI